MDLCEKRDQHGLRHPWELARIQTLRHLIRTLKLSPHQTVLDAGCGDGYTAQQVFAPVQPKQLTGFDIYLTEEQITHLHQEYPHSTYANHADQLPHQQFDLILFLDVLEHIEFEVDVLREHAEKFLAPDGAVLITVPAFQSLFSQHDVYLKHYRRYSLGQLQNMVRSAGLTPVKGGYLFGSLLPVRTLSALYQKVVPPKELTAKGIGQWTGGKLLTSLITSMLYADNRFLLALSRLGIHLPGLTSWVLCKPQP